MIFDQHEFDIRLEWGLHGVELLAPISDVVIIVDILSFSTSVGIATANGAKIYPYRWKDETAIAFAESVHAYLADFTRKQTGSYSLSPTSLVGIPKNSSLVLPSPNGSTLSLSTGNTHTVCGSLRNAEAVAAHAMRLGKTIAVIPSGERWQDGSLRPSFEDFIAAGAIIYFLKGNLSPESKAALSAFSCVKDNLTDEIMQCSSGKELIDRGFINDIYLACDFNKSNTVPILQDGAYVGDTYLNLGRK